jgi:hypothetical protein
VLVVEALGTVVAVGAARGVDSSHAEVDWVHQSAVVLLEACVEVECDECGDVVAGVAAGVAAEAGCAAGRIAAAVVAVGDVGRQVGPSAEVQQVSLAEHIVAGNLQLADMGYNPAGLAAEAEVGPPEAL